MMPGWKGEEEGGEEEHEEAETNSSLKKDGTHSVMNTDLSQR